MKDWLYTAAAVFTILTVSSCLDGHAIQPNHAYVGSNPTKSEAYQMCREIGGPNAWFVTADSGKIICVNKRGNKLSEQPK